MILKKRHFKGDCSLKINKQKTTGDVDTSNDNNWNYNIKHEEDPSYCSRPMEHLLLRWVV